MSSAPVQTPGRSGRDRQRIAVLVVLGVIAVVLALAAAWLFFFGSEAPAAPSLDDALRVLASPSPG